MHRSILSLIPLFLLGGCSQSAPVSAEAQDQGQVALSAQRTRVDHLLDSLSLRARIGQLVMPWVSGAAAGPADSALVRIHRLIDSLEVGGLLVSTGTPHEAAAKLNALQQRSKLPLLVSADFEGGTAFRWTGGTPFPTNMGVGAGGSEGDAYIMGRVTAEEGRSAGVHLNFAPVADVNNNPANPIINTRSFGANPAQVSRMVAAAVRGVQDGGMIATAKHFPGHGDTGTDSHIDLPVIAADWARLDSVELPPFRAAIAAGVAAVMSAHVAMPGIDGGQTRPATLAPNILTGILRDSLGFDGLIVTDALDMGALIKSYGQGEAAVLAFLAGSDLLLQPSDPRAVVDAMEAAVQSGRISEARLNSSVRRVLAMKERVGLFRNRLADLDAVDGTFMSPMHQAGALGASRRSIVLVRDGQGAIDAVLDPFRPIAVIGFADRNGAMIGDTLAVHLRRVGHQVSLTRIRTGPTMAADIAAATRALGDSASPLFAVAVRVTSGQARLALPAEVAGLIERTAARTPSILVSFGSPYVVTQTPGVQAYLTAWTSNIFTERAVAEALSGWPITGRLPIPIPPGIEAGTGIQRVPR